jgi:nucleoside-diphosphate-sugar epimerase
MRAENIGLARTKAILWRVGADIFFANLSLGLALIIRYLFRVSGEGSALDVHELNRQFLSFYALATPVLAVIAVSVFSVAGVYTRTRFYVHKHKALVLFQAVTVSYLLFIFSLSFILRKDLLNFRGIFVLSYFLGLLLFCGTRFVKHAASTRYDIVERPASLGQRIQRVLVIGGAGYIGSVLVRQLLEAGYTVRVLDAVMFGNAALEDVQGHERFELIEGDLRQVQSVVRAVRGSDAVIHLGAIVGDPACALDAQNTRDINTVATKLILHVCVGYGIQRFLFASTCAVYGASDHLMDERSALNPVSLYAQSKADAEAVVLDAATKDFCPVVLRLATAFGHSYRPRFDLVVNLLVAKAWKDRKITIFNKDQWRPFVHVHDISRAFVTCLTSNVDVVRGQIFNLGSYDLNLTLGQLAEKIKEHLPETQVDFVENDDRRDYRVAFDKIHSQLGFRCDRTVEDGIAEIKQYLSREDVDAFANEVYDNSKRMKSMSKAATSSESDAILQLVDRPRQAAAAAGR